MTEQKFLQQVCQRLASRYLLETTPQEIFPAAISVHGEEHALKLLNVSVQTKRVNAFARGIAPTIARLHEQAAAE